MIEVDRIEGLDETLAVLMLMPKDMHDSLLSKLNSEAAAVASAISGAMPSEALSGWQGAGVSYNPARATGKGTSEWTLYKVVVAGRTNTMADLAGAGGSARTPQGTAMIDTLNSRYGSASRWAWPTAEAKRPAIELRIRKLTEEESARLSRKLEA